VQVSLEVEQLLHDHEHESRAGCWICALVRYLVGATDLIWSALGDLRDFAKRPQRQDNLLRQLQDGLQAVERQLPFVPKTWTSLEAGRGGKCTAAVSNIGAFYSPEEGEWLKAMEQLTRRVRFPSWSVVLEVAHRLGYRRLAQ
jgi:hypothetical protein